MNITRPGGPAAARATAALATALIGWCAATPAAAQDAPQDNVRRAVHVCAACHGDSGISKKAGIPSLAGQMPLYTIAQLRDFRSTTRAEAGTLAYMWGVSALLDDDLIKGLADYYGSQPGPAGTPGKTTQVKAGERLFAQGVPARGVRACASCHGEKAEGAAGFPRLAGQRADYVQAQLKVFSTKLRPHGVLMKEEVKGLSAGDMQALAAYVQSL